MVDQQIQTINQKLINIYGSETESEQKEVSGERQTQKALVEGIYIFVSFDLLNSTIFKSRHKKIWPAFIASFYESVSKNFGLNTDILSEKTENKSEAKEKDNRPFGIFNFIEYVEQITKTNGFHLWKLLGDEVLFYHKVVSKEELYATIQFIDYKRKKLIDDAIQNYIKSNISDKDSDEVSERKTLLQQYFNVKTTVWIGNCAFNSTNITLNMPNAIYGVNNAGENERFGGKYDFMGPDIDEGFRLCTSAEKGVMLVSPKLVYLLLLAFKNDNDRLNALNQNFRIANYVSFKGVWEQRPYPLILYCQSEGGKVDSIDIWKKQFEYDAFENSNLFKNIDKHGNNFFHDDRFSINSLHKIYEDIVRNNEVIEMEKQLEEQGEFFRETNYPKIKQKTAANFEYHISCLCRNKNGQYWVTNHPTHGWSFGCVQVTDTDYCEYVKQAYKEKYNLDIEINKDSPILSFYTAKRLEEEGGTSILGTIILVDLENEDTDENINHELLTYAECLSQIGSVENMNKIDSFNLALQKAEEFNKEKIERKDNNESGNRY